MTAPLLTVDEAGASVKLGREAIYRAVRRGDLAATKLCGRIRIRPEDLDAWISDHTVAGAPALPEIARLPQRTIRKLDLSQYRLRS